MLCLTRPALRLAVHARLVSCCKTYSRSAVTAEVTSSSLVVPATHSKLRAWISMKANGVSADAKIPIVPVEFSPPPDVVNRSPLQTEEVPKLVKGERRARTKRTATARDEYPGDQQADRLGPQDDSQVCAGGGVGTGVWPTLSTA